jgi:hypothetical protein
MIKRFKVLKDRVLGGKVQAKAGDIVYDYLSHDYGLANEDSRILGIEHTSVTNDPDGGSPSFTISVFDIEEIRDGS